jgi:predicted AAA+ superfamily ATPase
LEQVLSLLRPSEAYFYAVHGSLELDLFIPGRQSLGVEFKRQDAPKVTKSMRQAIADLELEMLWVVYPGSREIQLDDKILAKPISRIRPD